nr:NADH:flavin oxidoreductase/NADH oxidase [Pararhodobacter sp. CCB-MM2]
MRNRLALSPMCQYSATNGFANDYHIAHYAKFAIGGFGLVMVEATSVAPEGRITHGDLGIWNDMQVDGLERIATIIKTNNALAGIQIGHAGPRASTLQPWHGNTPIPAETELAGEHAWPTVSASSITCEPRDIAPVALDDTGLDRMKGEFVAAARRAVRAGFDVIEVHSAHGFLLNSFLSPLTNERSDAYGGSRENRMRFPLEVVSAIRAAIPESMPLFVRISAVDGSRDRWTIEDSVAYAHELSALGVDVVDNSSGGFGVFHYPMGYGFQVPYAERIKRDVPVATMAVGLIVDAKQAEDIVTSGRADIVAIGHAALRDP